MTTLQPVIELLKDPNHWTTGTFARDHNGIACTSFSPKAACWCIRGALRKMNTEGNDFQICMRSIKQAIQEKHPNFHVRGELIAGFNDNCNTKHEMVIEVLNRAEEILQQGQTQ